MLTSTIDRATQRMLLPLPTLSPHQGRLRARHVPPRAPSSPAGLYRRPWLARLRRALAAGRFVLHYQPIVSLTDGRVAQYEALLRLADEPDGSLIAPGRFLPAAERYGLIRDIDRMVLGKVAALLADGCNAPAQPAEGGTASGLLAHGGGHQGARVAVNMSALSITDRGMLAFIERRLAQAEVDASRLVIELTETASISDMQRARAFCAGVQRLGCAVALDDFGAGWGSLQYLKHLPFRYLKIDGNFIRGLPGSRKDQLVVQALVGLVKGMGARTIAEFVADSRTLGLLRDFGVDYAQGYALGRPRPLASLP